MTLLPWLRYALSGGFRIFSVSSSLSTIITYLLLMYIISLFTSFLFFYIVDFFFFFYSSILLSHSCRFSCRFLLISSLLLSPLLFLFHLPSLSSLLYSSRSRLPFMTLILHSIIIFILLLPLPFPLSSFLNPLLSYSLVSLFLPQFSFFIRSLFPPLFLPPLPVFTSRFVKRKKTKEKRHGIKEERNACKNTKDKEN